MIRALNKELFWYGQHDPEFSYTLTREDGRPVELIPPSKTGVPPTDDSIDRILIFTRQGKRDTPSHKLSSFSHHINLHDDKGANLVDAVKSRGKFPVTEDALETSPYIITILDPTQVTQNAMEATTQAALTTYLENVQFLCDMLSNIPFGKKFMAICISKIDTTEIKREPWMCIKSLFGQTMYDLISTYNNPGSSLAIEAFVTSSVGHYHEGLIAKSNYDSQNGTILYPDQWTPCNVAKPFFWIFEHLERETLDKQRGFSLSQANYIPYPTEYERPC